MKGLRQGGLAILIFPQCLQISQYKKIPDKNLTSFILNKNGWSTRQQPMQPQTICQFILLFLIVISLVSSRISTDYFLRCPTLSKSSEKAYHLARAMTEPVLQTASEVNPVGLELFGGALDDSMYTATINKVWNKGIAAGDYHNGYRIRGVVNQLIHGALKDL